MLQIALVLTQISGPTHPVLAVAIQVLIDHILKARMLQLFPVSLRNNSKFFSVISITLND